MSTASESVAELGVCTIDDLGMELSGEDAPKAIAAINAYLAAFAKPVSVGLNADGQEKSAFMFGRYKCCNCGEPLGGVFGRFAWGFVTGEGKCTNCGWACRAHHYPRLDGETIFEGPIGIILQYLPVTPDEAVNELGEAK